MLVPIVKGEPIGDLEIEIYLNALKSRIRDGRSKYGPSHLEVDLKQDIVQECLDQAAYCILMARRIQMAFPDFEGEMDSNEWYERRVNGTDGGLVKSHDSGA